MKKTKGRQKIEMKKIAKKNDRMVTFSKRKSGIYKKINELSTLCGAEIAFLAFSAAGNSFTFGSPSFEAVAGRFVGQPRSDNISSSPLTRTITDAHNKVRLNELSKLYSNLIDELDAEKERSKALTPTPTPTPTTTTENEWWRVDPSKVEDEEVLVHLMTRFEDLYNNLCNVLEQKLGNEHA